MFFRRGPEGPATFLSGLGVQGRKVISGDPNTMINWRYQMARTFYRSKSFGNIEKYTWVNWTDDGHEYLGILLNRSYNGYFNFLALYQDSIVYNYPREYLYYDYELKSKINMRLYYNINCVEYSPKKESENA